MRAVGWGVAEPLELRGTLRDPLLLADRMHTLEGRVPWPPLAATWRTLIVAKSESVRLEVLLGGSCLVISDRSRIRTHGYRLPSRASGDGACDQNLSVVEKSTSIRSEFSGPGLMK